MVVMCCIFRFEFLGSGITINQMVMQVLGKYYQIDHLALTLYMELDTMVLKDRPSQTNSAAPRRWLCS